MSDDDKILRSLGFASRAELDDYLAGMAADHNAETEYARQSLGPAQFARRQLLQRSLRLAALVSADAPGQIVSNELRLIMRSARECGYEIDE